MLGCVVAAIEALLGEGKKLPHLSAKQTSWAVLGQMGVLGQQLTKPVWFVLSEYGKQNKNF